VSEKRILRRIFGPKRDEVTGDRRKLHDEQLYKLYSSPNNIRLATARKMRLGGGHVVNTGEKNVQDFGFWW
jgi:hypothetical protein